MGNPEIACFHLTCMLFVLTLLAACIRQDLHSHEGCKALCRMLPTSRHLPSLFQRQSVCQKMGVFLHQARSENHLEFELEQTTKKLYQTDSEILCRLDWPSH